ncbi:MAG: hypothetical protein JW860_02535 [Sedimentisphaerales bacterium]|nr:hypothetical protein [Sedimentisphaerales bacterium]
MDVFFYEAFDEEEQALKRFLPADIRAGFTWKTIQEYGVSEPAAQVISTRTQSLIPVEWASKLTAILTRSTGFDHIHAFLKKSSHRIACGYLPLYCHRAVAEQAMVLWMALLRKLPGQIESFKAFHRDCLTGHECAGKTLLVVGVGNIGFEVVRIGQGLDMDVLGVDIVKKHEGVNYVTLDEGLAKADIIVCAMNLTCDNYGYFNHQLLKRARHGVVFINIARGELSPSDDLLQLLQENHVAGVGLDVYNHESELAVSLRNGTPTNNPEVKATLDLARHANVILTPHNAFNTHESVERKSDQSIQQINHLRQTGQFLWPVPEI